MNEGVFRSNEFGYVNIYIILVEKHFLLGRMRLLFCCSKVIFEVYTACTLKNCCYEFFDGQDHIWPSSLPIRPEKPTASTAAFSSVCCGGSMI